jgi:hypothetical protein
MSNPSATPSLTPPTPTPRSEKLDPMDQHAERQLAAAGNYPQSGSPGRRRGEVDGHVDSGGRMEVDQVSISVLFQVVPRLYRSSDLTCSSFHLAIEQRTSTIPKSATLFESSPLDRGITDDDDGHLSLSRRHRPILDNDGRQRRSWWWWWW